MSPVGDFIIDLMAAAESRNMRITGIEISRGACDELATAFFYDRKQAPKDGETWGCTFNGAKLTVRKDPPPPPPPPPSPAQRAAKMLRELADKLDKETS